MELQERKRSFDISKLTPEDADALSTQIGQRVTEICDKAVAEANRLLNIYGMEAKMQIAIGESGSFAEKPIKKQRVKSKKAPKSSKERHKKER